MITYQSVLEAKKRIEGHVIRTPLLRIPALDKKLGCKVYLKPENLQYTGSFKLRGASNKLLALTDEERKRGVVCASSGNHAQGVACAANRLGIDAIIVMPTNCNRIKLQGVESFGAKTILVGTKSSEREDKAKELVKEEGKTLVPPYDDDYVRAGQGTIGIEILEDEPDMDVIVVPIGGGGLISGVSTAVKAIKPTITVIGAEPKGASRYGLSRKENKLVWLDLVNTIADGTRTDRANKTSFNIIQSLVDELVTATDDSIRIAMKEVVANAKIIAEPSSVLGIAATIENNCRFKSTDKVCFVISGGNNDLELLSQVITI